MIGYRVLLPSDVTHFSKLTYPQYRRLLELEPDTVVSALDAEVPVQGIAVGALAFGEPVGLALGAFSARDEEPPQLLSLFVEPPLRNRGIGTTLVRHFERRVSELGFATVRAEYQTGTPGVEALERILERCAWEPPETDLITVHFTIESLRDAPWMNRYSVPTHYEVFPWTSLTSDDRDRLMRSHADTGWIAPDLLPWDYDRDGFEPMTSVGLRYKGDVVGWVINHQVSPDTVRYTCSYIRPDLGRLGRIVLLYSASFNRLPSAGFRNARFATPVHHPAMVSFARRWFGPWSTFLGEVRASERALR